MSFESSLIALVDCNNFYVSCERVFNPKLLGQPLIILSNNDGCVIARSNEAKKIGIAMGEPYFKCLPQIKKHQIKVFSSNFALYGDMSQRVMSVLNFLAPSTYSYSIDEAFLLLSDGETSCRQQAISIKQTVQKWTGIPVSIGVARTKTLAKLANRFAKNNGECQGVRCLLSEANESDILSQTPVADIWGIGHASTSKLNTLGIHTALQFRDTDTSFIKKHFTVVGVKTLLELRGQPSITDESFDSKKSILCSRSFRHSTRQIELLQEAISSYMGRVCEKLRAQNMQAKRIDLFLETSRFKSSPQSFYTSIKISPTADTRVLTKYSLNLLKEIYKPAMDYKRAGVVLHDLISANTGQQDLFSNQSPPSALCMQALDSINRKWGRGTIFLGAAGTKRTGHAVPQKTSSRYTTCWQELPVCRT